jgi:hypothetical protein
MSPAEDGWAPYAALSTGMVYDLCVILGYSGGAVIYIFLKSVPEGNTTILMEVEG